MRTLILTLVIALISAIFISGEESTSSENGKKQNKAFFKPEQTLDFAYFLYKKGELQESAWEYQRYLHNTDTPKPKSVYRLAYIHYLLDEHQKSLSLIDYFDINKLELSVQNDFLYLKGYVLVKSGMWKQVENHVNTIEEDKKLSSIQLNTLQIAYHTNNKQWEEIQEITKNHHKDPIFSTLHEEIEDYKPKKPFVSLLLSSIIPGAGKIYSKQYSDAMVSFMSLATIAGLTGYSYYKNGFESWRTWAYGITAGVFYSANLYGSYNAALRYNSYKERIFQEKANDLLKKNEP